MMRRQPVSAMLAVETRPVQMRSQRLPSVLVTAEREMVRPRQLQMVVMVLAAMVLSPLLNTRLIITCKVILNKLPDNARIF